MPPFNSVAFLRIKERGDHKVPRNTICYFSKRSGAIPQPIGRGVARDNHFHIAVLLATQNRWSGRRGLRREPRIWSSKGCGLPQVECKRRWKPVGKKNKNSDAGSKLGFISITKTVVIGHFGNSLALSDASILQRKSITAWQVRAEKKSFVFLQRSRWLNQSIMIFR